MTETSTQYDYRAENERLHAEIRGLNGQVEGLMRVMAGLHARLEKSQAEVNELKAILEAVE